MRLHRPRRAAGVALLAGLGAVTLAALPAHAAWQPRSDTTTAAATATPTATPPGAAASGGVDAAGRSSTSTQAPATSSGGDRSGPTDAARSDAGQADQDRASATAAPSYQPPAAGDAVATGVRTITPSERFGVRAGGKGTENGATWPDAGKLFTADELRQVVPGTSSVRAVDCAKGSVSGGATSARSTRCTLELTRPGSSVPSRVLVVVRAFGTPQAVGSGWSSTVATAKARSIERPGLYTFYRNGALNASAAFTDGTTTRVLLQRNGVAGEVWFSGVGFTDLRKGYLPSRQYYRDQVSPALVNLLAAKMPG